MAIGSGVRVDWNADELVTRVEELRERGGDLSGTMAVVADLLVAAVNDEFESQGRGNWPPLAASTHAKRRGSTAQIHLDTGRFAGSIRADSGEDWAEAATDVSYAVYHVSDAPRSIIPKRDPFDVDEARLDEGTEIILAALIE